MAAGEQDAAIELFEVGIDFERAAGFKPDLAFSLAFYAGMLIDRDKPGDREKVTELQDEAIAIATDLGMKPLLERVLAQREILKA